MTIATVDGIRIDYQVTGQGEPLLLIMGLGYSRHDWQWIIPSLSRSFQTIVFDNRCVGESDCPDEPFTIRHMADDAAGLLDFLGIDAAHVFGVSMGGHVAQELAINHPDKILKLVLACCHLGPKKSIPLSEETMRHFTEIIEDPEERIRKKMPYSFRSGWVEDHSVEFDEIVRLRLPHQQTAEQRQRQFDAALTHDTAERVGLIRAPTLVLQGTADRVVPLEMAALIAGAIPNARIQMLEGAGHLFFIEEPALVAQLIEEFCLQED